MADVLEVDRKKLADVVRDTSTSEYEGRWWSFRNDFGTGATRWRVTHFPTSCAGRRSASGVFQRIIERQVLAAYLSQLKARGCRLGIVTDCSAETPLTWNSSWLNDVMTLSRSRVRSAYESRPRDLLGGHATSQRAAGGVRVHWRWREHELYGAQELGMAATMLIDPNLLDTDRSIR